MCGGVPTGSNDCPRHPCPSPPLTFITDLASRSTSEKSESLVGRPGSKPRRTAGGCAGCGGVRWGGAGVGWVGGREGPQRWWRAPRGLPLPPPHPPPHPVPPARPPCPAAHLCRRATPAGAAHQSCEPLGHQTRKQGRLVTGGGGGGTGGWGGGEGEGVGAHALQRGRHTLGPPPLNTLPTARGRADDAPLTARAAAWMSAATCLDWNMSQSAWRVGGLRVTGWVGGLGGVRVVSSWVNCVGERGATAAGARPSARVRSSARPALARSHAGTTLTPPPPRPLHATPPPPPTHTHTPHPPGRARGEMKRPLKAQAAMWGMWEAASVG